MNIRIFTLIFCVLITVLLNAQDIAVTVNPTKEHKTIPDALYGRNNNLSDEPNKPLTAQQWQFLRDAGIRFGRESSGNNSTKHNWRLNLSSHPDWFNNVYFHDWHYEAQSLQQNLPGVHGMWAFQLLGKVAANTQNNWPDLIWSQQHGFYPNVNLNLAGGGSVDNNGNLINEGNAALYTMDWPADSTVGILNYWFNTLQLNKSTLKYWSMDNEPEVWDGTHNDVLKTSMPVEDYITRYVEVAKKARAIFPEIKIVGPVFTNEWQWYSWQTGKVTDPVDNKKYVWSEYFIKRIAEEQQKSGVRLLDVLAYHFYPEIKEDRNTTLQVHRIYYDTTWVYPKANGVKLLGTNDWNPSQDKEYIFERANRWLKQYMGETHGVAIGMTECGTFYEGDPNVTACWYASHLGEFAKNNVEVFSPWEWDIGQWEVMHLFTHYTGNTHVLSTSSLDSLVSAYSSINANGDTLSVVLVNRDVNVSKATAINITGTSTDATMANVYQLANLPATETFKSKTDNALNAFTLPVNNNTVTISLPKLSVTAVQIPLSNPVAIRSPKQNNGASSFTIYPNPAKTEINIQRAASYSDSKKKVKITNTLGQVVLNTQYVDDGNGMRVNIEQLLQGIYYINIDNQVKKFVKQ